MPFTYQPQKKYPFFGSAFKCSVWPSEKESVAGVTSMPLQVTVPPSHVSAAITTSGSAPLNTALYVWSPVTRTVSCCSGCFLRLPSFQWANRKPSFGFALMVTVLPYSTMTASAPGCPSISTVPRSTRRESVSTLMR